MDVVKSGFLFAVLRQRSALAVRDATASPALAPAFQMGFPFLFAVMQGKLSLYRRSLARYGGDGIGAGMATPDYHVGSA